MLAVVTLIAQRLVPAALLVAAVVALIMYPQHPWSRQLVVLVGIATFFLVAVLHSEIHLGSANDWLNQRMQRGAREVTSWIKAQGAIVGVAYLRLFRVAAAAIGVTVSAVVPLAVGDRVGADQASSRTVFYIVADRACASDQIVIDFADGESARTVRVAQRSAGSGSWLLLPGVFSIAVSEPVVQAQIGRVASSDVPRPPLHVTTALPPLCT